jgi:hypothetical protein
MVEKKDIDLLLHLSNKPEKATPLDFEWLANLLDQFPGFDLLRKVFVEVGLKFGATSDDFMVELNKWELRKPFYVEAVKLEESNKIDQFTTHEKIEKFLNTFKAVYSPQGINY